MNLEKYIVIDLETSGLIEKGVIPKIICYSWCDINRPGVNIDLEYLHELLRNKIPVFHNAKFDVPILRHHGFDIKDYHDTMLMSYVLDTSQKHSLEACGASIGLHKEEYDFKTLGFEFSDLLAVYAEKDALITWNLFKEFYPDILNVSDHEFIYELELAFLECVMEYEATGLPVDTDATKEYEFDLNEIIWAATEKLKKVCPQVPAKKLKTFRKEHPELKDSFHSCTEGTVEVEKVPRKTKDGKVKKDKQGNVLYRNKKVTIIPPEWNYTVYQDFNFNSRHHKAYLLQQEGWNPTNYSKDEIPVMGESTLNKLVDHLPSAQTILDITKASKTLNTFIKALLQNQDDNGFVHTNVNQMVTRTGRLSSSRPNLQNLPSRGETGDKIRSLIKAPDGHVIIGVDLSNIEARILAYYLEKVCHDSYLADVFRSGSDLHDMNAQKWGLDRDMAKKVLYLTSYGGGAEKLAVSANIPLQIAESIIAKFFAAMPAIDYLKEMSYLYVKKHGFIRTILHRRVHYPDINSNDPQLRSKAERQCFNALLQGSAADIIKKLSCQTYPLHALCAVQAMIQNHDENLWLAAEDDRVDKFITKAIPIWNESKILGNIPIVAEFKTGKTWSEVH